MRTLLLFLFVVISSTVQASELQLKKVLLSSGGVGHFEYEAQVMDNTTLELSVPLNQVDDVLKSITVYDNEGTVKSIEIAGKQPLAQIFKELPFSQSSFNSTEALLNDLQGAEIKVDGVQSLEGKIIGVNPQDVIIQEQVITKHRVSVLTSEGVKQFILEDAEKIEFADKKLNSQIKKALSEIENNKAQDSRTLKISLTGNTKRTVQISYIVEVPLWKTTYRLVIADNPSKRLLQGWAVLENMSGKDWENVSLALVSGNPVTFKQPLYTSYYVPRPEIPVSVANRVLPKVDEGAVVEFKSDVINFQKEKKLLRRGAKREALMEMDMEDGFAGATPPMATPAPMMAGMAQAVEAEKGAASVSFKFPNKISVKAGHSLVVPIINDSLPMERVALYQPETHKTHPLATVEVTNNSKTALPQGILTIYELKKDGISYEGDAQLADFPAGEKRLVSFAVDNDILIDKKTEFNNLVVEGKINKGVFHLKRKQRETSTYLVKAPDEDQTLIVEQPKKYGWKVVEPKEVEITDSAYRIKQKVKGEGKFSVVLERLLDENLALINMNLSSINYYIENGELSLNTKRIFRNIADFKEKITEYEQKIYHLENNEKRGIIEDQERIRGNLRELHSSDKLRTRYLEKLEEQENRIEEINSEIDDLIAKKQDTENRMREYISNL